MAHVAVPTGTFYFIHIGFLDARDRVLEGGEIRDLSNRVEGGPVPKLAQLTSQGVCGRPKIRLSEPGITRDGGRGKRMLRSKEQRRFRFRNWRTLIRSSFFFRNAFYGTDFTFLGLTRQTTDWITASLWAVGWRELLWIETPVNWGFAVDGKNCSETTIIDLIVFQGK